MKIDIDLNVNVGLTEPAMALVERLLAGVTLPPGGGAVPAVSSLSSESQDNPAAEPEKVAASKPRGRPKKNAEVPTPAEPAAAEAEQDAADEAAESAAQAPQPEAPAAEVFTLDTLRNAAGAYVNRFGMPAAQADLPGVIGFPSISAVPEGKYEEATLKIRDHLAKNPNKHPVVGAAA